MKSGGGPNFMPWKGQGSDDMANARPANNIRDYAMLGICPDVQLYGCCETYNQGALYVTERYL